VLVQIPTFSRLIQPLSQSCPPCRPKPTRSTSAQGGGDADEHTEFCPSAYLKALKLPTVARQYKAVAQDAAATGKSYVDFLATLLKQGVLQHEQNGVHLRIQPAYFPFPKTLDPFNFTATPSLNKANVVALTHSDWIDRHENPLLIGSPGTGVITDNEKGPNRTSPYGSSPHCRFEISDTLGLATRNRHMSLFTGYQPSGDPTSQGRRAQGRLPRSPRVRQRPHRSTLAWTLGRVSGADGSGAPTRL
jgi:hypothetical protein